MGLGIADYVTIGTTAANVGGSLLGGILTNKANARENQKNRDWNLEMWNKTNEYNSPINVRKRLEQAGLNPALAYSNGDGTSLASYAGNLGTQKAYENPVANLDLNDAVRVSNETLVAESTAELNDSTAAKNKAETRLISESETAKRLENRFNLSTLENRIEQEVQKLEVLKNEKKISDKEYEIKVQEYNKQLEAVRKAKAEADKAEEEFNTQKALTQNVKAQTGVYETQQQLNKSQSAYYDAAAIAQRASAKYNMSMALQIDTLTGPMKTQLISQARKNMEEAKLILEQAGLTKNEADKVVIEAYQAIENGKTNRALTKAQTENTKSQTRNADRSQRFGTSWVGAAIGLLIDGPTSFAEGASYIIKGAKEGTLGKSVKQIVSKKKGHRSGGKFNSKRGGSSSW